MELYGDRIWTILGLGTFPPILENDMEKHMDNEMTTGIRNLLKSSLSSKRLPAA